MGIIIRFFQLLLLLTLSATSINSFADTTVPNVLGLTLDKAKQTLQNNGLSVGTIKEQRTNRPTGTIIVQAPKADVRVANGYPVRLVVAIPLVKPSMTKVPNLKGLSFEQAKQAIAKANLTLGLVKRRKIKMDDIEVLYQSPKAGKSVVTKNRVDITLSEPLEIKGPRIKVILDKNQFQTGETVLIKTKVSNVDSSKDSEYSFSINGRAHYTKSSSYQYTFPKAGRYNITASFRYTRGQWHASLTKRVFVKDKISANTTNTPEKPAKEKSTKEQTPTYLRIPNVVGLSKSSAIKQIKKQGFHIGKITEKESSSDKNIVLAQSPTADKKLSKGASINLVIAIPAKKPTWQAPKAIISPIKLSVTQGKKAKFSSQSLKDKAANLQLSWTSSFGQTATGKQFIVDTQQLKAGQYQVKLFVKDNKGNTDKQTATLIITSQEAEAAAPTQGTTPKDNIQEETDNTTSTEQATEKPIEKTTETTPSNPEKNYLEALSIEAENTTEDTVLPQLSGSNSKHPDTSGKISDTDVKGQKPYIEPTPVSKERSSWLWTWSTLVLFIFAILLLILWRYHRHHHRQNIAINYQLKDDDGQQELNINDAGTKENISDSIHISPQMDRGEQKISINQTNKKT